MYNVYNVVMTDSLGYVNPLQQSQGGQIIITAVRQIAELSLVFVMCFVIYTHAIVD